MVISRFQGVIPLLYVFLDLVLIGLLVVPHALCQCVGICRKDAVEVHEGIDTIAVLAHSPYLGILATAQELLESLAHKATAHIEDEVGLVGFDFLQCFLVTAFSCSLLLSFQCCQHIVKVMNTLSQSSTTVMTESGRFAEHHCPRSHVLDAIYLSGRIILSHDNHRTLGLQEVSDVVSIKALVTARGYISCASCFWQLLLRKLVERFLYLNIDMNGSHLAMHAVDDGFVGFSLAHPMLFFVHDDR